MNKRVEMDAGRERRESVLPRGTEFIKRMSDNEKCAKIEIGKQEIGENRLRRNGLWRRKRNHLFLRKDHGDRGHTKKVKGFEGGNTQGQESNRRKEFSLRRGTYGAKKERGTIDDWGKRREYARGRKEEGENTKAPKSLGHQINPN